MNIITRKSYDGFTIDARVGSTDDGEGQDRNVNLIFGTSGDKGRIMATLGYRSSDELNMADQAGCALAEMTPGQLDCFGSSSTIGGRATILTARMLVSALTSIKILMVTATPTRPTVVQSITLPSSRT